MPCVLRDPSHEHEYDLSGLRRSDFDYVTSLDDDAGTADSKGEVREVHVNFCDVLVSLPEAAKGDCAQSGACLIKKFANGSGLSRELREIHVSNIRIVPVCTALVSSLLVQLPSNRRYSDPIVLQPLNLKDFGSSHQ